MKDKPTKDETGRKARKRKRWTEVYDSYCQSRGLEHKKVCKTESKAPCINTAASESKCVVTYKRQTGDLTKSLQQAHSLSSNLKFVGDPSSLRQILPLAAIPFSLGNPKNSDSGNQSPDSEIKTCGDEVSMVLPAHGQQPSIKQTSEILGITLPNATPNKISPQTKATIQTQATQTRSGKLQPKAMPISHIQTALPSEVASAPMKAHSVNFTPTKVTGRSVAAPAASSGSNQDSPDSPKKKYIMVIKRSNGTAEIVKNADGTYCLANLDCEPRTLQILKQQPASNIPKPQTEVIKD